MRRISFYKPVIHLLKADKIIIVFQTGPVGSQTRANGSFSQDFY